MRIFWTELKYKTKEYKGNQEKKRSKEKGKRGADKMDGQRQ